MRNKIKQFKASKLLQPTTSWCLKKDQADANEGYVLPSMWVQQKLLSSCFPPQRPETEIICAGYEDMLEQVLGISS
jgi:hypothetical protein